MFYIYDANGARTRRVYFCNNGTDPYPTARLVNAKFDIDVTNPIPVANAKMQNDNSRETASFQIIEAIYPNPTTGKFFVTLSVPIINTNVTITDINGKVIQKSKASGNILSFDISKLVAGVYFVNINSAYKVITKKILKQKLT